MWDGVYAYMVGLAGLGGASAIEIVANRRGMPIIGAARLFASVCGIADIVALVAAFFVFSFEPALAAVLCGMFGAVVISKIAPDAPTVIYLVGVVGFIGLFVSLVG